MNALELRALMETFIAGRDRTVALAGALEVALDDLFGEKEPFATVVLALASYRPGGGDLLHDEDEMVRIMVHALEAVPSSQT